MIKYNSIALAAFMGINTAGCLNYGCAGLEDDVKNSMLGCVFPADEQSKANVQYLKNNLQLLEAMKLCKRSEGVQERFWHHLQVSDIIREPSEGILPSSYPGKETDQETIVVTQLEAEDIYAAHLAHSIWVDKNRKVPWRLTDYNHADLDEIFTPKNWFVKWSPDEGKFEMRYFANHSPKETWEFAASILDFNLVENQRSALVNIIDGTRQFDHKRAMNEGNLLFCVDYGGIITIKEWSEEKKMREGCQSSGEGYRQLAASLNIPASTVKGYYAGKSHKTFISKYANVVLAHSDDPYSNTWLENSPAKEIIWEFSHWNDLVMSFPKGDPQGAHNSLIRTKDLAMKDRPYNLLYWVCKQEGWAEDFFAGYKTMDEINKLVAAVYQETNDCADLPDDKKNPLGKDRFVCTGEWVDKEVFCKENPKSIHCQS